MHSSNAFKREKGKHHFIGSLMHVRRNQSWTKRPGVYPCLSHPSHAAKINSCHFFDTSRGFQLSVATSWNNFAKFRTEMPLSLRHAQGKTCSVVQSGTNFALGQPDCPISSGITWDCWNLWRFGEITNKNLQHFKTCHPLATEWKTYSSFSSFPHHQNQLETWKSCFSGRFVHVCPFLPWFPHNYMFSITNLTSKLISPHKKTNRISSQKN